MKVLERPEEQLQLFRDGGPYHRETSPLIYIANQWTGFYMILTSVMKELKKTYSKLIIKLQSFS